MVALVDELEPRFGPGRILRPYRDVRFSKDKSPYRTSHGAMIGDVYVQVSARGIGAGGGYYHLAPDQLERYRAAVAARRHRRGPRAADRRRSRRPASRWPGADPLKTAPRGYAGRPSADRATALPRSDRVAGSGRLPTGCRRPPRGTGSSRRSTRRRRCGSGSAPRSGRDRGALVAGGAARPSGPRYRAGRGARAAARTTSRRTAPP